MSAATPGGKEPAAAPRLAFADAARVSVGGVIGEGLEASMNGRLKWFIRDERSEAIRVYRRKTAARSPSKGWLGECAGKWLYAASRCLARTGDPVIERHVRRVAGFLVSQQCEDGYLGTYSTADRFCAPGVRRQTFDLWMNGYVMQGLMRAATVLRDRSLLASARRIADLCIRVYRDEGAKIVNAGPFSGMASACVLEHFVDLYDLTGAGKYLDFAAFCLRELDRRPGVEIVRRTTLGYDAAQIGEGKMYEMIRCLVGMAKLARATRDKELCAAVENAWREISAHHLNAAGAPCGGVGGHLECFNVRYAFSPYAFSETCAMMEWLRLTIELLRMTGAAACAGQIERIAYNALPGAQFPDGFGWTYHSVMNGTRTRTGEFACCSSSGAMAWEEIPRTLYATAGRGVCVNVYAPSAATLDPGGCAVRIEQETAYPFDGKVKLTVHPARAARFSLALRVPEWLEGSAFTLDGGKVNAAPGTYHTVSRVWRKGDTVTIEFPMPVRIAVQTRAYNEKGWYLDGETEYRAVHKGPLLYATRRRDTPERQNPLTVSAGFSPSDAKAVPARRGGAGTALRVALRNGARTFVPYYAVCGRENGTHHVVWMKVEE